jgi:hypothetical protein
MQLSLRQSGHKAVTRPLTPTRTTNGGFRLFTNRPIAGSAFRNASSISSDVISADSNTKTRNRAAMRKIGGSSGREAALVDDRVLDLRFLLPKVLGDLLE